MEAARQTTLEKLGQGRAAQVFVERDAEGRPTVRKIFGGDGASKLVLWLLTGAANPYAWCEAAIRAACARRRILARLVDYWFGDELRLPRTFGWGWNREQRAYEIRCEQIHGRHAPLRGPGADEPGVEGAGDPVRDLVHGVMKPLQRHLAAAGCDGLVWQAGRGNPVAASNFMLERPWPGDAPGRRRWVWIDLESGVPALFAMNPLATLGFYLPKSLHHGRWLFDDVDVPKLRRYVEERREEIERAIGPKALGEVRLEIEELHRWQQRWKWIPRHERSIAHEVARGRLSKERAEHYAARPLRWNARLAAVGAARCVRGAAASIGAALRRLRDLDLRQVGRRAWRFCSSQRYRTRVARALVAARVRAWSKRRFLDRREAGRLLRQLRRDDAGSYLTDFAVHLMLKPPVKLLEYFVVPALVAFGWLDLTTAAVLILGGGLFARTLYTAGRIVHAAATGRRRPWVALGVGLLPVVGNAAFPAQLLHSSTERDGELARFILLDAAAAIGRAVPVWGGEDSLTEHAASRAGHLAVRWLQKAGTNVESLSPLAPRDVSPPA